MKLRIIFEERTDVGTRYELRTQTAEDFETAEELVERAIDWLSTKPRDRDGIVDVTAVRRVAQIFRVES